MEKKELIILISLVGLIFILVAIFLYNSYLILGVENVEFSVIVGDNVGLNVDTDRMYFGTVPLGGIAERGLSIRNDNYPKAKARIHINSEISDWVSASNNNLFLKKGEEANVNFMVEIPSNVEKKEYNGSILVIFTRF